MEVEPKEYGKIVISFKQTLQSMYLVLRSWYDSETAERLDWTKRGCWFYAHDSHAQDLELIYPIGIINRFEFETPNQEELDQEMYELRPEKTEFIIVDEANLPPYHDVILVPGTPDSETIRSTDTWSEDEIAVKKPRLTREGYAIDGFVIDDDVTEVVEL